MTWLQTLWTTKTRLEHEIRTNRFDGLTSSILAGNTYKAFEMAPKILAGIVNVNSPTVNDEIHAPMGGVRDSGWGRTGPRSLDDFSDVIWINAHSGQRQYPFFRGSTIVTLKIIRQRISAGTVKGGLSLSLLASGLEIGQSHYAKV
jgi:hypothetical protein